MKKKTFWSLQTISMPLYLLGIYLWLKMHIVCMREKVITVWIMLEIINRYSFPLFLNAYFFFCMFSELHDASRKQNDCNCNGNVLIHSLCGMSHIIWLHKKLLYRFSSWCIVSDCYISLFQAHYHFFHGKSTNSLIVANGVISLENRFIRFLHIFEIFSLFFYPNGNINRVHIHQ